MKMGNNYSQSHSQSETKHEYVDFVYMYELEKNGKVITSDNFEELMKDGQECDLSMKCIVAVQDF